MIYCGHAIYFLDRWSANTCWTHLFPCPLISLKWSSVDFVTNSGDSLFSDWTLVLLACSSFGTVRISSVGRVTVILFGSLRDTFVSFLDISVLLLIPHDFDAFFVVASDRDLSLLIFSKDAFVWRSGVDNAGKFWRHVFPYSNFNNLLNLKWEQQLTTKMFVGLNFQVNIFQIQNMSYISCC